MCSIDSNAASPAFDFILSPCVIWMDDRAARNTLQELGVGQERTTCCEQSDPPRRRGGLEFGSAVIFVGAYGLTGARSAWRPNRTECEIEVRALGKHYTHTHLTRFPYLASGGHGLFAHKDTVARFCDTNFHEFVGSLLRRFVECFWWRFPCLAARSRLFPRSLAADSCPSTIPARASSTSRRRSAHASPERQRISSAASHDRLRTRLKPVRFFRNSLDSP